MPVLTTRNLGLGALILAGAVLGGSLLSALWPLKDRSQGLRLNVTPATLAAKPRQSVTVLIIGTDADQNSSDQTAAAPKGPVNADALLLVRINPKGPLQVLNLPVELAVMIPGDKEPSRLADLYRRGGVALTRDGIREVLNLADSEPQRFVVLPRAAMRKIVDGVGGLEISPTRTMKYQDKAQKYKIDLQTGLQRLNGSQVEQMLRFMDKDLGESGRRNNHKLVETSLREQWSRPDQLANLPALITTLRPQVDTNLTPEETLSLMAVALDTSQPIQFASLPLQAANKDFGPLRQLDAKPSATLWPAPGS
jgi:LCP family protein required for cell wall assembly